MSGWPQDDAHAAPRDRTPRIMIEATPAELIRRIVLLELALEGGRPRLRPPGAAEDLARLVAARDASLPAAPDLDDLADALRETAADLLAVRQDLRTADAQGAFGEAFVALARAALQLEAEQARLEARIDEVAAEALLKDRPRPSA